MPAPGRVEDWVSKCALSSHLDLFNPCSLRAACRCKGTFLPSPEMGFLGCIHICKCTPPLIRCENASRGSRD